MNNHKKLIHACKIGNKEYIKQFIKENDISEIYDNLCTNEFSVLNTLCGYGFNECVELFIDANVNVNIPSKFGVYPIHSACQVDNYRCLELLIKAGADINKSVETNHKSVDINIDGSTPLYVACEYGSISCLKILLQHNLEIYEYDISNTQSTFIVDVNKSSNNCRTPLFISCEKGHAECVKMLIDYGVDINKNDYFGWTPLHIACDRGHTEIVNYLIKAGANIHQYDLNRRIPLLTVKNYECFKLLVDAGVNIEIEDCDGESGIKNFPEYCARLLNENKI